MNSALCIMNSALKIVSYRVGVHACYDGSYARAAFVYYVLEQMLGVLLALIVAYDSDLYLLLMGEVFVIVHLTSQECISLCINSLRQHECSGTSTDGNALYGALQEFVAQYAGHAEHFLYLIYIRLCCERLWQLSHDACASGHAFHLTRLEYGDGLHVDAQPAGYLIVHASLGAVEVGVHRDDGDTAPDGLHDAPLYVAVAADVAQLSEYEGMMGHNHVAPQLLRLADYLLRNIKA